MKLYTRRMQIEQAFRDLKSHHHGSSFEDSLTRSGHRLQILLLVHALVNFASWLAGLACQAAGIETWLYPAARKRKLYSTLRVGREALVRAWPIGRLHGVIERLRTLPADVIEQMATS